jgi:hypothetical protein
MLRIGGTACLPVWQVFGSLPLTTLRAADIPKPAPIFQTLMVSTSH